MVKWANDGQLQANDGKMLVNDGEMFVNDGEMLVNDGDWWNARQLCWNEYMINDHTLISKTSLTYISPSLTSISHH